MRNIGPVVALTGALLIFTISACDSGGTTPRRTTATPTPPGGTAATPSASPTTPAGTDSTGTGNGNNQIGSGDNDGGDNTNNNNTPVGSSTAITDASTVSTIVIKNAGAFTGSTFVFANNTLKVSYAGAEICNQFDAYAEYEGSSSTGSVTWQSAIPGLVSVDGTGKACVPLFADSSASTNLGEVALTVTPDKGVNKADKAVAFKVEVEAEASASATVN